MTEAIYNLLLTPDSLALLEVLILALVVWIFLDSRKARRDLHVKIDQVQRDVQERIEHIRQDIRRHEKECDSRRTESARWQGRVEAQLRTHHDASTR